VHALLDGRDCEDGSSVKFVKETKAFLEQQSSDGVDARIASGGGRMQVTMDRYEVREGGFGKRASQQPLLHATQSEQPIWLSSAQQLTPCCSQSDWDIVERGWRAHVLGEAPHTYACPVEAVTDLRGDPQNPVSDQQLEPFVIVDGDSPVGAVQDGDSVVIFNFRADRVVQLSQALEGGDDFTAFDRKRVPAIQFAGMMQYDGELQLPKHFLVAPPTITDVSGTYLAASGVSVFACSETQKFGHVTFFWNGNRSGLLSKETETYKEV